MSEDKVGAVDFVKLIADLTKTFGDAFPVPAMNDDAALNLWGGLLVVDAIHLIRDFGGLAPLQQAMQALEVSRVASPALFAERVNAAKCSSVEKDHPVINNIIKNLPQIMAFIASIAGLFGV